ncbi:hypothetical protein [Bacillus rubiinfantis]|uniref:hypothetical protein n=1 Tax=Bacillus rubiinfantis TaxID=1499680 RepID=UPI0005A8CBE3|nr:hypothetical protein [Bacillus rubiinfantis]
MNFEKLDVELPTVSWRARMLEGDDIFTEEGLVESEIALLSFVKEIKSLENQKETEVLEKVKEVVIKFNEINEKFEFFIETMEREELYEFIDNIAREAGLNTDQDITEEWREW